MRASNLVIIAAKCRVAALNKSDGALLWETALNESFFKMGETFVSVAFDDTGVYAHTLNEAFCLDIDTGRIVWRQKLVNLGRSVASVVLSGKPSSDATNYAEIAAIRRRQSNDGGGSAGAGV